MDRSRGNRWQSMGELLAESGEQYHGRFSDGEGLAILHPPRGNAAGRLRRIQVPAPKRSWPRTNDAARALGRTATSFRPTKQLDHAGSDIVLAQRLEAAEA